MLRRWYAGRTAPRNGKPFLAGAYGGRPYLAVWDKDEERFRDVAPNYDSEGQPFWPSATNIHLWAHPVTEGETVPFGIDDEGHSKFAPKSKMGEPHFTLVARDPFMGPLIRAWAYLRTGRRLQAEAALQSLTATVVDPQELYDEQIRTAFQIADKADEFQKVMAFSPRQSRVTDPSTSGIRY